VADQEVVVWLGNELLMTWDDKLDNRVNYLMTRQRPIGWNCVPDAQYRKWLQEAVNNYLWLAAALEDFTQ
jgi:hypothetical protein